MKISSPNAFCILATVILVSWTSAASAQSNVRDFGPPTHRRGVSAAPGYYVTPNYAVAPNYAATTVAYPSPYAQVGYQPITLQRPGGCAYNSGNGAYPYANAAYTAGYSPYANANTSYWSSTTPAQYTGASLFGSPTVYDKEQPLRNVMRFFVP